MLSFEIFRNRGFQYAAVGSLLWHAFWLFGVSANFTPAGAAPKPTRIYFLGPVLTDDSFNMILATKPELSETRYVADAALAQELEPALENLGRQSPGDLVSVPSGGATWNILRGVLESGRARSAPPFAEKFNVDIAAGPYPVTGALAERGLLRVPKPPPSLTAPGEEDAGLSEAVFALTVNAQGDVVSADVRASSGSPERDLEWRDYLKKWQFVPLPSYLTSDQKGEVRIRPPQGGEEEAAP